ncbi:unnamed protein product [Medioppia subpectinata]|uniref:VWFA domain-containing protein n=1 Tax=Medioppia subpectinata TaxID=1979941 RepID=A0A7R9KEX4_9ACAR|nr:unnamed protein product [Medioppia subpectinata]CAG2102071.1 unnamed protein product [Medioppia subpectinata]
MDSMDFLNDDNDDDTNAYKLFGGKEGIVFIIDVTKDMFTSDGHHFSLARQCVENVMKNKAIANPSDESALIFMGTDKTDNELAFEHIVVDHKLQKPSVDLILGIRELTEEVFETRFGHNGRYSLADVFMIAISEFTKSKSHFATKRVILMTCCANPYSDNTTESRHLRSTAISRAKDFKDHNIDVELIPIGDQAFDTEVFYESVFPHLKDDKSDNNMVKLDQLMSRVYSKNHTQRILASLPFRFGSTTGPDGKSTDVQMTVYVYSLCLETKKPTAIRVDRNDNKPVVAQTQRWTADVGASVTSDELHKKYNFGAENILMNKSELKTGKQMEDSSITLLPKFGSLRCADRKKVVICRLTLRKSSPPHLVALLPQREDTSKGKPGGFQVIYLPFKEEVRHLAVDGAKNLDVKPEAIELAKNVVEKLTFAFDAKDFENPVLQTHWQLAKNVVEKLTFAFDAKDFENPVLQTHWRTIEALALNEADVEPYDEPRTQPDYKHIETEAGYDMYSLNTMLGAYNVEPTVKPVTLYTEEQMRDKCKQNKIGSLTVAELKAFCNHNNISVPNNVKKADLIQLVAHFYTNK